MGLLNGPRVHPANTMFNPEVHASEVFRQAKSTRELVDSSIAIKRLRSNELPAMEQTAGVQVLDDVARLFDMVGNRLSQTCRTHKNHCVVAVAIGAVALMAIGFNAGFGKSDRNAVGTTIQSTAQESCATQSAYGKPGIQATDGIAATQGAQYSAHCNNAQAAAISSSGTSRDTGLSFPSASGEPSAAAALVPTRFANSADDRDRSSQVAERAEGSQAGAAAYFRYGDSIDKKFRLGRLLTEDAHRRL